MSFEDYSTTPSANTSIAGRNVAPGGPPSAVGPALRQLMADGAELAAGIGATVSVLKYNADPTGGADSSAVIAQAILDAGIGGTVLFPPGTYRVNTAIQMGDSQTWKFDNVTLVHSDDTKTMIVVPDGISGWSILGRLTLEGLLVTAATTTECGLHITNGKRYRVEGVSAIKFKGKGFWLDGATGYAGFRGARGQFTDCSAHECTVGLQIDAGGGAEYTTWANFTAGGNITGATIGGGNSTFLGGNFVDNEVGIYLIAGANHGHGTFIGTNINHNNVYNLHAIGVINGYTFTGCHFYGNTVGSATSSIWFEGCKGFVLQGGIIDCWLLNDTGTGSGINKVLDNYFPNDYGVQLFTATGGLGQLYLRGNFLPTGESELNDAAAVYVDASRLTTAQSFTSGVGTAVVFNSETRDKGSNYDSATGIFTAPVAGFYQVSPTLTVGASAGFTTAGYMTVVKNAATEIGYVPVVPVSATLGVGSGTMTVQLNAGETAKVFITVTATSPNVTVAQSRVTIRLLG